MATKVFQTEDEIVLTHYNNENNNLIEYDENSNSNYAAIYFSSNGIYYPNDQHTFYEQIVKNNRYEWMKNKIVKAKKHIFLRDIFKQWYLEGINKNLNSIAKVFDFLKRETKDMKIITLGGSSGGYAAILFGILLNAEYVFSFAGQFSLLDVVKESSLSYNPIVYKYKENNEVNKYFDLTSMIKCCQIPIFYFVPVNSEVDFNDMNMALKLDSVHVFSFISKKHGVPCFVFNLPDILNRSKEELVDLAGIYNNKRIDKYLFSLRLSGLLKTNISILMLILRKIKRIMLTESINNIWKFS